MYKTLILIAYLYSVTATAGNGEISCNQAGQRLKILPLTRDLAFGYIPKKDPDTLYFYAVVPTSNENPDNSLQALLKIKGHLTQRQRKNKSIQAIYEVPKRTRKIYFITSKTEIQGFEPYARIEPSINLKSGLDASRSPSNYSGDLLNETTQSQTEENTQPKAIEICEYVM